MIIEIPDLTAKNVIDFSHEINSRDFSEEEEIIYDYATMSTFEPFGMLVMSSLIRNIVDKNDHCKHRDINFKKHSYGGTMGFFQSVYQDFGKRPGEALGSNNYIPMTSIDIVDFQEEKEEASEHIGEAIERQSNKLAKVFSCGNKELMDLLTYMIREIMRNIIEHSNSSVIWFAGQHWPSKKFVEIAILDEGIGIASSLMKNIYYKQIIKSDKEAIALSMLPGVTKTFTRKKRTSDDVWANSGYGLYVTSQLCNDLNGSFIILSGNHAMRLYNREYRNKNAFFKGTAIRMRINTSSIGDVDKRMKVIVNRGEEKARTMKRIALGEASSASKSITISKLLEI